jgi:hypothetical protein
VGGVVTRQWWEALPAVETWVPCGSGMHPVRWEKGALQLPAHPDAEGELVLAALGGERAYCVELAEAWGRRTDDLEVLAILPRSEADAVAITWKDVEEFRNSRPTSFGPPPGSRPMRPAPGSPPVAMVSPHGQGHPAVPPRAGPGSAPMRHPLQAELERLRSRHLDLLSLLALGPAFQMSLSGTVAAAWADGGARAPERSAHRPALEAALNGRLAPAAAAWLGVDPDRVDIHRHEGPGWGSLELTASGRRLHGSLPVGWLSSVWACGLAVVGGHLVVAVRQAAWPEATVLAVPEPGRDPVVLTVRAVENQGTLSGLAHWEVCGVGRDAANGDEAGEK